MPHPTDTYTSRVGGTRLHNNEMAAALNVAMCDDNGSNSSLGRASEYSVSKTKFDKCPLRQAHTSVMHSGLTMVLQIGR